MFPPGYKTDFSSFSTFPGRKLSSLGTRFWCQHKITIANSFILPAKFNFVDRHLCITFKSL